MVIEPGETKTFIFKTRLTDKLMRYYAHLFSFLSKVELDESAHAYRKYIGNQLLVMVIFGVCLILFIYNLILFLFDGQRTSIILAFYFILIAIVISNTHGITSNYLFVNFHGFEMLLALNLAHLTPIVISSFLFFF